MSKYKLSRKEVVYVFVTFVLLQTLSSKHNGNVRLIIEMISKFSPQLWRRVNLLIDLRVNVFFILSM